MNPCMVRIPVKVEGIFKNIQPTTVPIITASNKNPPKPNGSRIVIQKFRIVKYQICRNRDTPGALITGSVGIVDGSASPEDDTNCLRFQASRSEFTLSVEFSSACGVRL